MSTSVKKNILKNGAASVFQQVVKVAEQLLLVPFFISAWGAAYYGEWLTLTIIPSIIAFSDLGFGSAAANTFVLNYAAGDYQKAANTNKMGIFIITRMIAFAVVISALVMLILSYFHVFDKSLINRHDAIAAVVILLCSRLLNFYSELFQSYYRAARRASLGITMLSFNDTFSFLAGITVLLLGKGIVVYACAQLIVLLVFNIIYSRIGKRLLADFFKNHKGAKDTAIKKEITRKGFGYMMSPIWQAIYFQGTTFVVRIVLGAEAVAVYNTVRTLTRSVNQLFTIINNSIYPELQFEIGLGNMQKVQKIYRIFLMVTLLIALVGVLLLVTVGFWFYGIWTHHKLNISHSLWNIFMIGILFNALWWTSAVIFRSMNQPHKFAKLGLICAFISVIVSYIAAKFLGLLGAALGACAFDIMMAFMIMPIAKKLLHMPKRNFFQFIREDFIELITFLKLKLKV
ncbi:MAG: polysaccharide biosynthesis C-terminal domain-containing protein [Arachidicoccus sp.]|nr:polysaccharide biosynthesis C-terminal domain-containing protein [Arachidicoccus sp.]